MIKIIKLRIKQTVNNVLYYCNKLDIILIHDFPFNSKVFI
jgi:hypothetical protein